MTAVLHTCFKGGNENRDAGYWLGFVYNLEVVEELKRSIPHTYRRWDADKSLWWVSAQFENVLKFMFCNFEALVYLQQRML